MTSFHFTELSQIYSYTAPQKNVIESKHKTMRDIFLRIKSNNADFSETAAAQQAIRISNELYGNETCSSHKLDKGFIRPIIPGTIPKIVP